MNIFPSTPSVITIVKKNKKIVAKIKKINIIRTVTNKETSK
jgi:hypothetical protein